MLEPWMGDDNQGHVLINRDKVLGKGGELQVIEKVVGFEWRGDCFGVGFFEVFLKEKRENAYWYFDEEVSI